MISALSSALSGLKADSTAIDVVGNDLANLNTTGYKSSSLEFASLMSQQLGSTSGSQIGMGVAQVKSFASYTQGSIQSTSGPTDAAIQGNGFFMVKDQNNQTLYTRNGSFHVNSSGLLTDAYGNAVQGWTSPTGQVNTNGVTGNINIPLGATIAATPTTKMSVAMNLDARVDASGSSNSFSTPIQVVDSEGVTHTLTASFTKTAANAWDYKITIPDGDLTAAASAPLLNGSLTFDSTGNLMTPDATGDPHNIAIPGLKDGAADMSIDWNLYDASGTTGSITQYAQASGVAGINQDGFQSGQINDVSFQDSGALVATYSNGQKLTVGQIALASISNPESLIGVGNNDLAASTGTATPAIGTAGSGSRGQIIAGSLESSTVDIAQEFTHLLTFERSYQANSRVITTADQLMQETVNLIHP